MRINQPQGPSIPGLAGAKGSIGMPPAMKEALRKQQEEKHYEAEEPPKDEEGFPLQDEAASNETAPPLTETSARSDDQKMVEDLSPEAILKKLGIELTDDDFHNLLFKGYIEKDIMVIPGPKDKDFVVNFKTLTGQEYCEVDELLAEDVKDTEMTNMGYETRRNMWILAYSVKKIAGKPIVKPVMKKGEGKDLVVDPKETAKVCRKVIGELASFVIDRMIECHGSFIVALKLITGNTKSPFLRKS